VSARPFYMQLVRTTGWYKENGQSSWGLGIQIDHFADFSYGKHEAEDTLVPSGWQLQIQLGTWALFLTSPQGVVSLEGPNHWPKPFFEVVRA
jgi:hypothetical protein